MSFDDDPEASLEIIDVSHTNDFSDQAGDSVAQLVVQDFNNAGFATAFAPWLVLPGREPFGVSSIKVAINEFSSISSGQRNPQAFETSDAAVAVSGAKSQATNSGSIGSVA